MDHPIQPVETDDNNVVRFKENKIVTYLLDNGGIDLNDLAVQSFSADDRNQFAQLIGYSVGGFASLDYAAEDIIDTAYEMCDNKYDTRDAQIRVLTDKLNSVRDQIKEVTASLFSIHSDDLTY